MASRWIVKRGDQERGPFTSPQLKSLADSGQIHRTDLVTKQGENRYVPAEKVKGLFAPKGGFTSQDAAAKPKAPVKPKSSSKPASNDDGMDFGVVEIIDDDDPVIVVDESNDDFNVFDFEAGAAEVEDFDEPQPARSSRSGSSRREATSSHSRGTSDSRRAAAPTKPAKSKKPAKKRNDEDGG